MTVDLSDIDMELDDAEMSAREWLQESLSAAAQCPGEDKPVPAAADRRKKYDVNDQLSEFKRGVDEQLDEGDTESHYDLGIAYKEMCLFDAAVAEFQIAAQAPQRRIDCLTLEGICYRDNGDYDRAEKIFSDTLSREGLSSGERSSLRYELAFLLEKVGRREEAIDLYRQVRDDSPGFRDAAMRVSHLQGGGGSPEQEEMEPLELEVEEPE